MRRSLLVAGLALLALPALGAPHYDPSPVHLAAPAEKDTWVSMIRDAREAVEAARLRYDAAVAEYSRMRSRRKARGERKVAVEQEQEEAKAALDEAERGLHEVLGSARRANVPPGWIREALEGFVSEPASHGSY